MIDLDELIAEARKYVQSDDLERNRYGEANAYPRYYGVELVARFADALESVRAERDAALARIAELERKVEGFEKQFPCDRGCNVNDGPDEECSRHGRTPRELWEIIAHDVVGRDAATERAELAEARIAEAAKLHRNGGASQGYTEDGYGYIENCCETCGTFGEYGIEWPCPTAIALGLDEGDAR